MPKATITRAVSFPAGHRYYRSDWSEARNEAVFGKCARSPGHGHNYSVEVTVEGEIHPDTGMVADVGALDAAICRAVLDPLDHAFLNSLPEFADGLIPTTENLARVVWERLQHLVPDTCRLSRIRVAEDRTLWAEYCGG
jgi:6-pyruvoyltetrahydropterin/6-carboxytetrahydropterin synthase